MARLEPLCVWRKLDQTLSGFVSKVRCEGGSWLSIGNPALVQLEALPKEIGCGVLLRPLGMDGSTNLILETSVGTIRALVDVSAAQAFAPDALELRLKGDPK